MEGFLCIIGKKKFWNSMRLRFAIPQEAEEHLFVTRLSLIHI